MDQFLVILFIGLALSGVFLRPKRRKSSKRMKTSETSLAERGWLGAIPQPPSPQWYTEEDELHEFPYALQKHFLSPTELNFFQHLRRVVGERTIVCTKVSLGDVFWVKVEDTSKFRGYRNKIDRKHVDFLLCDAATMRPLVGVELDDSSHQRPDRQARDEFVDGVFAAAGLPLLHIPARQTYEQANIATALAPFIPALGVSSAPGAVAQAAPQTSPAAPKCPNCECNMVLRTVKNGPRAGAKFWGCINYPHCRGMLPYNSEQTAKTTSIRTE